jgi:hypothetical protein
MLQVESSEFVEGALGDAITKRLDEVEQSSHPRHGGLAVATSE